MNITYRTQEPDSAEPLSAEQRAIVRVTSLVTDPDLVGELSEATDVYGLTLALDFLLYVDVFDIVGASLKEQMSASLVERVFENWEQCREHLVTHMLGWTDKILSLANGVGEPFDDLLTWDDEAFRTYLSQLGFQVIDTGESVALFRRRPRNQ